MRSNFNCFLIIFMVINFLLSMLITLSYYNIMSYSIVFNYFISLILINNNTYSKNFINIQTIFLIGSGVFIFGRFFAVIINPDLNKYLYCIDFIFNYCASNKQIFDLNFILHLILISFSMSFVFLRKKKMGYEGFNENRNLKLLCYICLFFVLMAFYNSLESVYKAITSGYMALYTSQAEVYQSPYALLINSIASASLGFLYSVKQRISKKLFFLIFIFYVLSLMLGILTGSRSGFIAGLILILWFLYKESEIKIYKIILFFPCFFSIIFFLDKIASLTGARDFNNTNGLSFLEIFSNILYNQGITLMVFNTSINIDDYPLLGILKTLFPGIQVFYSFFGVDKRYQFDWSSYMTYNENKIAYDEGYGLGWSIFSDLYILSYGFLPLFCLFVYLFGLFLIKILSKNSNYNNGIIFISTVYFFAITRGSISPYIFTLIIYTLFSIYYGTLGFGRRKSN